MEREEVKSERGGFSVSCSAEPATKSMATEEDRVDSTRKRRDGSSSYSTYSIRRVQETDHETLC